MSTTYEKKTATLWRSYDYVEQAGEGNPFKLLCSAIVFQAACDCEAIKKYGEATYDLYRYAKGAVVEMSRQSMVDFIKGEWLENLLSWQGEISIDAVRENLMERLGNDEAV